MANKIVFFEDSLEIYERGVGYFDNDAERNNGSIHVAFEDAFRKHLDKWNLELFITRSQNETKNQSKEKLVSFLDPDNFKTEISEVISDYDKVFVFMDSFWLFKEKIRNEIIQFLIENFENIYFCAYSAVSHNIIDQMLEHIKNLKYDKKVNTFMLDRGDAPVLYTQCYNAFKRLLLIAQGEEEWDNDIDLTSELK